MYSQRSECGVPVRRSCYTSGALLRASAGGLLVVSARLGAYIGGNTDMVTGSDFAPDESRRARVRTKRPAIWIAAARAELIVLLRCLPRLRSYAHMIAGHRFPPHKAVLAGISRKRRSRAFSGKIGATQTIAQRHRSRC